MDFRKIATGLLPPLAVAILFAGWMGVKDRNGPCGFVQLADDPPPLVPEIDDSAGPAPVTAPENLLDAQSVIKEMEFWKQCLDIWARVEMEDQASKDEQLGVALSAAIMEKWLHELHIYLVRHPEAANITPDESRTAREMAAFFAQYLELSEDDAKEAERVLASGKRDEASIALIECRKLFQKAMDGYKEDVGQ